MGGRGVPNHLILNATLETIPNKINAFEKIKNPHVKLADRVSVQDCGRGQHTLSSQGHHHSKEDDVSRFRLTAPWKSS